MAKRNQRPAPSAVLACLPDGLCGDKEYAQVLEADLVQVTGVLLAAIRTAFCKGVRYGEQRERRRRRKS
jgi:hypothetical protein